MILGGYRPREAFDVPLPAPLADGVYLCAFDPVAQGELGIWRRLFDSADVPVTLMLAGVTERAASSAFPPSALRSVVFVEAEPWRTWVGPDRPERSFALVARGGTARILVVGPPTEECWDRVAARLGQ